MNLAKKGLCRLLVVSVSFLSIHSARAVVLLLALLVAWLIYIATPRSPAKTLNSSF
jgi:chromate transport protein ChrA